MGWKARKTGASLALPGAATGNVSAVVTDASSFFSWHALPQGGQKSAFVCEIS